MLGNVKSKGTFSERKQKVHKLFTRTMGSVEELFWVHCTATQKMGPLGGGGHVVMGEKAEQSKSFLWVGWYFSLGWAAPKSGVRKCMKEGEGMSTSFIATASKTNKQTNKRRIDPFYAHNWICARENRILFANNMNGID